MSDRIRYLAYGSNLHPRRLAAYIDGADHDSRYGRHVGARDRSPAVPVRSGWHTGELTFAGRSRRWGGGVATIELEQNAHRFFGLEYDLSRSQLEDLVRQENREPSIELDWDELEKTGSQQVGSGLYGMVRRPPGTEAYLITAPSTPRRAEPVAAYVDAIRSGLLNWLVPEVTDRYLGAALAGVGTRPVAPELIPRTERTPGHR